MPKLASFFEALRRKNIRFVFVTNNSTRTSDMYVEKFESLGIEVRAEQVLTSAEATADHLRGRFDAQTSIFTTGVAGLREALTRRGFTLVEAAQVRAGARPTLVVMGFNGDITYEHLAMASLCVRSGAEFIATNLDMTFPTELGPMPGSGALAQVVASTTGVAPLVIGKPQPAMFAEALRRLDASPETTAMVGDRLDTDILGGQRAELYTILLLSGVTSPEQLRASDITPDLVLDGISALASAL